MPKKKLHCRQYFICKNMKILLISAKNLGKNRTYRNYLDKKHERCRSIADKKLQCKKKRYQTVIT